MLNVRHKDCEQTAITTGKRSIMPLTAEQEQKIRDATPMDDFTIRLMLRKQKKLAESICRIILKNDSLRIQHIYTEYDASSGGIARGCYHGCRGRG